MTAVVREAVAEFIAAGWKLCRIQPGSKGPRDKAWNEPGHEIRAPEGFPPAWGVGLLHAWSGTMALDIDNYPVARAWLEERGVDLDELMAADDAVQISSGKVNSAKLLYACPARPGASCAPYPDVDKNGAPITKSALDFRCGTRGGNTQQDALPPTIHPGRAQPYVWILGLSAAWQALPPLPAALEAIWDELASPVAEQGPTVAVPTGAPPERIAAWLATQDPGMTRNDWVKVGMKLHAEFQGSPEGFEIWQRWSAGSVKWDDEARQQMYPVWSGFKLEGRGLATLESDLRTMPAEADEFPIVEPDRSQPATAPKNPKATATAVGELIDDESPAMRQTRECMEKHVVLQTGGAKSYFLLPGHPIPEIAAAAGLAGVELSTMQLGNVFGPYLPPVVVGKMLAMQDPATVMRHAKWRRTVHRMGFNPGGPESYSDDDGHAYLNAYKPIPIEPAKPRPHEIAPLEWLLRRVLDDTDRPTGGVFAQWLVRLYAFCLRNPGVKVKWAPLLYSAEQGTGKTTLMETLPALLFGRQYVKPMVHTVLRERFAGARFDSTWWVCLSEMHSDAGKVDAKTIANKLKPWITDDSIQIEKKGVDSYDIRNYLQFTACSNNDDALFIEEGSTDRRWLIGEMWGKALTTAEKTMLNPLLGGDFNRDPKAQNWLHWYFLENVDISGFNPAESPPDTAAKRRVKEQSRSLWEDRFYAALETRAPPFDRDLVQPLDITEGLLVGQRVTIAQAKSLLKRAGAVELARTDTVRSIWCIRNFSQWEGATASDKKAHFKSGHRPFEEVDDASDLL